MISRRSSEELFIDQITAFDPSEGSRMYILHPVTHEILLTSGMMRSRVFSKFVSFDHFADLLPLRNENGTILTAEELK